MTNAEIGKRIKETRIAKGKTLEDIASEIGVARSTIQRYEAGKIDKIKLPVISAIADALGVYDAWLIGKSDKTVADDVERFNNFAKAFNAAHQSLPSLREKELITNYRKLNDTNKGKVDTYISGLLSIQSEEEFVQRVEEANAREKEGS